MNKKSHDHGFTIKKATEQIRNREDNTYNKKTIEKVLKMYAEECTEVLLNGEKVNIRGIGTIRPNISEYAHCGLPTMKGKENTPYTVVRIRVHTSDILREKLKERLSSNSERGIVGLEGEKEWSEE